jgi:nucleoside-diphosphate-sugar epimerase
MRILASPAEVVSGETIYVGDPAADILLWVSAFSRALTGRKPRVVPRPLLRTVAFAGDMIKASGKPFPLFSSRYRSMTQSYFVDMNPTIAALGDPKYSLEEGVKQTVEWLKSLGGIWIS